MSEPESVGEWMRRDWNQRAREDAHYYVAFGSRNQDEEAFLATAADVVRALTGEMKRLPTAATLRSRRALEIGCGPGRLMMPLSQYFGEIHGVDVSDEMIGLARERLRAVPHAHVHVGNGSSVPQFADASFDFIYSYAVFQHMPSREAVLGYMGEVVRLLKPGGIFRGQFNGFPPGAAANTWSGVSFSAGEIREFTRDNGLDLLALEGVLSQYMWTTWRKSLPPSQNIPEPVRIDRITSAERPEAVVPSRGRYAAVSLLCENLPVSADLNRTSVTINGAAVRLTYLGPRDTTGVQQLNAMLPADVRTGLVPVELFHCCEKVAETVFVRIAPPGPTVPRIVGVMDGLNVIYRDRSISGVVKVQLEDVLHPDQVGVTVAGQPVRDFEIGLTDPAAARFEANFRLPEGLPPGSHSVEITVGRRRLPAVPIELLRS